MGCATRSIRAARKSEFGIRFHGKGSGVSATFKLSGIIPPVCTPFTEQHEIDVPSLETLIDFQLDAGVHGLFMLGSTSETATLTYSQRVTVLETAVAKAKGRAPIMAGTMDTATERVLEHARAAKAAGVDALVVTSPFYIRPSQSEIIEHFRIIKQDVGLPIMAYDIPSAVHSKLARETVLTLADEGTIIGIKDSSGDESNFRGLLIEAKSRPNFAVFTGSELIIDGLLMAGATGSVPGICNVDPHGFVKIYNAVRSGDLATATAEQDRIYKLFSIIHCAEPGRMGPTAGALGGFKTALMLRGIIATNVPGRPMTRLNDAEVARVRKIVEAAGLL
jgi:4-hydroxy-tetrahydrodipicolinate synthase